MRRFSEISLRLSAAVLFAVALIKLLTVGGGSPVLQTEDPLVGVRLGLLLPVESGVEFLVAWCLVSSLDPFYRSLVVVWIGALFCVYHLALALLDPGASCPCLGTLYGNLGIRPATADKIAKVIAAWLFLWPLFAWATGALAESRQCAQKRCGAKTPEPEEEKAVH
jgi:hypothetical protein